MYEAKDNIDNVWASHKETFLKSLKEVSNKTFKLTRENMGMIKSMIKEMITAQAAQDAARTGTPLTISKADTQGQSVAKSNKAPFTTY
jgi:hypothetical protein